VQQSPEHKGRVVATGARCFECGSPMLRREGEHGYFWYCTSSGCGETFADREGHPEDRTGSEAQRKRGRRWEHDD